MDLTELEPQFVRREVRPCHAGAPGCSTVSEHLEHEFHVHAKNLAEADGIDFLCPKCLDAGGHHILCWRPGRVPLDASPGPGRWEFEGTGYADLTLSPSIALVGGCAWHGHIQAGKVTPA